jgi:putative acetyltransferase
VSLRIEPADPRSGAARELIAELDAHLDSLYPPENNYLLDPEALASPAVTFWIAADDERVLGCGALNRLSAGEGEIKRMYVRPAARGLGLGRRLLAAIEAEARAQGLRRLMLETGVAQPEAIGLYRAAGYTDCEPWGDYRADPLNLYLAKML